MSMLGTIVLITGLGLTAPLSPEIDAPETYRLDAASLAALDDGLVSFAMKMGNEDQLLRLEPFDLVDERTRFVVNAGTGRERTLDFDASSITLLRGSIGGKDDSLVYMAIGPRGALGTAMLDGEAWVLAPLDGRKGLVEDGLQWQRAMHAGQPPLGVPVCGARGEPQSLPGMRGLGLNLDRLRLDLAVETDYEFLELFSGDLDAAAAYITAMYGAVAAIYERDVDVELVLTFVRLWETPDDLFNDDDPLVPFRNYWNENMQEVDRDLAQFLTGRTNLPYGGVAYVSATCSEIGYSVSGYTLGSFYSATEPGFGNWDIVVSAHELGHNCGTYHTHDYGIDNCAGGDINRGSIMSYCHTTTGGNSNVDLRFHVITQDAMHEHLDTAPCLLPDCNGNGQGDQLDILLGVSVAYNLNNIPDDCEDCNGNGEYDSDDVAKGTSADVDGDGFPDECQPDCNGNGVPDSHDILEGTSTDLWGNGIPDDCEEDCDGDGTSDYNQIQADMTLDLNRNAVLDACEDCDGDGTPDHIQLQGSGSLWIAGTGDGEVKAFHPASGVPIESTSSPTPANGRDVLLTEHDLLVSDGDADAVSIFDRITGDFDTTLQGGLVSPEGMALDEDGHLLVVSRGTASVERFDLETRTHMGSAIAAGTGGLDQPRGILVPGDGMILVTSIDNAVLEFDLDGQFIRELIPGGPTDLVDPRGMALRPGGTLLVTSHGSNSILEYDRQSGDFLGRYDRGGLPSGYWGLGQPWALRIGPDGDVYVSTYGANTAVQVYEESTGLFKRRFYILSQLIPAPTGFDFAPPIEGDCDGNLVLDSCEIASGVHEDNNGNGVPDICECPADLSGDGIVGVDDLLLVIAGWGNPYDVDDLLNVIQAWGPCEN
ncbi:MAG: hypothetical protein CMJ36_00460 [Phycisphaerae bacterium]|nr:hypothetical protein [Phycisphaerae bacterium]